MSDNKFIEQEIEKKFNQLISKIPDIINVDKNKDENDFFNFSVIDIYHNTLQSIIDIINDIIRIFDIGTDNYLKSILLVIFKENRLFYIGIILIILSFVIYFIDGATI